jgi:hypothetical protein
MNLKRKKPRGFPRGFFVCALVIAGLDPAIHVALPLTDA